MGGLLDELGKKFAERWISLLVLPGALFLAVAATAVGLGHAHALDVGRLTSGITAYAKAPAVTTTGGQLALLAAVLVGAAAIGVVAQALGALIERRVLAAGWRGWPRPFGDLADRLVRRRRRRWDTAHTTWWTERRRAMAPDPAHRPDPRVRHRAARTRDLIAVERPDRPTWSGDRIHAATLRLERDFHLDLATVWPHLWLVLPDTVRGELTAARTTLSRAASLGAWSVLYGLLVLWWWPAAPLAVVLAVTARHRTRAATDTYARLLEAAVRLHATDLAQQLDINEPSPLTRNLGRTLTSRLRTQLPPPSRQAPVA
ncbi:hypothetical protein OG723_35845 [Streptomyces sp. NBC_01278]|uniref:hypothetical protein n=1 Tax=Streptomyces sp. NBC_01278 TaxID=2903809 RepID=UPI002E32EFC8|nr:hypothetical protein [Streptomyces sp. NBC_01278]